jgi:hypothetical protein
MSPNDAPDPANVEKLIEESLAIRAEAARLARAARELEAHIKELEEIAEAGKASRKKSGIFEPPS